MNKQTQTRIILIAFLILGCTVGLTLAAVPQSTIRTTGAGITTYVANFVNATSGYYVGTTQIIDNTRAATFVTLDTGQGANELYDMDQNVLTTSDVDYNSVDLQELYLNSVNITDNLHTRDVSYTITFDGTNYRGINGSTGQTDFTGTDGDSIVNWALGNSTGVVLLREGTYSFDGGVTVGQDDVLSGEGWGTVINYDSGGNCITLAGENAKTENLKIVITAGAGGAGTRPNAIYSDGYDHVEVNGVSFTGDITVAKDNSNIRQCAIYIINSEYFKIRECFIQDFYYTGINLYQANTNGEVTSNQIINCYQYGIWMYNNTDFSRIQNNYVNGCRTGINIRDSFHNTIVGNTAEQNNGSIHGTYGYGILIFGTSANNTITGNTATKNQMGICIDETATRGNAVVGNVADNNFRHGIYLYQSHYNTITGNSARYNGEYGILINNDSKYNSITGNTVTHNALDGIRLDSNANTNNIVSSNVCNNNTLTGIRIYTSTKNTITGNIAKFNTGNGIYLQTTSDENVLSGNICTDNTESGIYVSASDHNTITGNTANGNEKYGLALVAGSHNNLVVGNTFSFNDKSDTNTYSGIILISSDNNTIQSNSLKFNDKYGIDVNGNTCDNTIIKINTLLGNGAGIINNAGTGTITRENEGYLEMGDIRNNAQNIEMYNGTAWHIIGP